MKLNQIVKRAAIVPRLVSAQRDEVVAQLIDALIGAGAADASIRQELVNRVLERERRGSTGFGKGVAVPHVKHKSVRQISVAVGLAPAGVEFAALDRQPVYIVFLVLSPEDRPDDHLQAMEAVFRHLQKEPFRRFLRQASTADDVVALIEESDGPMP
jgi:mannitol/fructose-specific phosphotransferase system IIA component (Ntr-type)